MFMVNSQKTAILPVANPGQISRSYTGTIYLDNEETLKSIQNFTLGPGESRDVNFPITMPDIAGTFPVFVKVESGGSVVKLQQDVDIQVVPPSVQITGIYIRQIPPNVSQYYSGWMGLGTQLGQELNLALYGYQIQAGLAFRNTSPTPLVINAIGRRYQWVEPNNYVNIDLAMPIVVPAAYSPAPTGLPYSSGNYEVNKFCGPGVALAPNEVGFVYCGAFEQGRRWDYVYFTLYADNYNLGERNLFYGWYSM